MEPLAYNLCEPYEKTVNTLARELAGRSGAEFDDLVQEGWEGVVAHLRGGSTPDEADIKRWMRSYIRQLERLHRGDSTPPFVTGGTPINTPTQMDIRDALKALPPELATVAYMHGFGYNNVEIGLHLGIHRTTVAVWLTDVRLKLRRELG